MCVDESLHAHGFGNSDAALLGMTKSPDARQRPLPISLVDGRARTVFLSTGVGILQSSDEGQGPHEKAAIVQTKGSMCNFFLAA